MTLSPLNRTLLAAIKHDDAAGVQALARAGADLAALEEHVGRSLLGAAVEKGLMLSALGLLQAGASLRAAKPGSEPALLHIASLASPPDCADEFAELMLAKGADPDEAGPAGERALHACARLGRARLARLLIEAGADVNALDAQGRSPLMIALQCSPDAATPALLIDSGARLDLRDRQGRAAADFALARGEQQVAAAIAAAIDQEAAARRAPSF